MSIRETQTISDASITVYDSPTASSNTADHPVSKKELLASTELHQKDVRMGLRWLSDLLQEAADKHDWTKIKYFEEFYKQFRESQKNGDWPEGQEWWFEKYHKALERHHFDNDKPDDEVTLIDVLEKLVDCVMAGMGRAGNYDASHEPSAEVLKKAYENTRNKLLSIIKLEKRIKYEGDFFIDMRSPTMPVVWKQYPENEKCLKCIHCCASERRTHGNTACSMTRCEFFPSPERPELDDVQTSGPKFGLKQL